MVISQHIDTILNSFKGHIIGQSLDAPDFEALSYWFFVQSQSVHISYLPLEEYTAPAPAPAPGPVLLSPAHIAGQADTAAAHEGEDCQDQEDSHNTAPETCSLAMTGVSFSRGGKG